MFGETTFEIGGARGLFIAEASMCGLWTESVVVVDGYEQENAAKNRLVVTPSNGRFLHSPSHHTHKPRPGKTDRCHSPPVMFIHQRRILPLLVLPYQALPIFFGCPIQERSVPRRDDRYPQRARQVEDHSQYTTDLPRQSHAGDLMALGPEEVEEESRAEDEGDEDAGENVVGCCADVIIIVFVDGVVADALNLLLLVDVVYIARGQYCGKAVR